MKSSLNIDLHRHILAATALGLSSLFATPSFSQVSHASSAATHTHDVLTEAAMAIPLRPGQTQAWQQALQDLVCTEIAVLSRESPPRSCRARMGVS